MSQNRNKLIDLLIGNLSNAVLHKILERAASNIPEFSQKYNKELRNSWDIAKHYREKINPKDATLPTKDIEEIKRKLIIRVSSEMSIRISKGYKNLNLTDVEPEVVRAIKELKIADQ